jgi:hypothetical protein
VTRRYGLQTCWLARLLRRADLSILRDPTRVVGRHLTLGRADDGAQQTSK